MKSEVFNDECDYSQILKVLEKETEEDIEKKRAFLSTYKGASTKALVRELLNRSSVSENDLFLGFEYMQNNLEKMQTEIDGLLRLLSKIQSWEESTDETVESRISNAINHAGNAYYLEHPGKIVFKNEDFEPPVFMPKPKDLM